MHCWSEVRRTGWVQSIIKVVPRKWYLYRACNLNRGDLSKSPQRLSQTRPRRMGRCFSRESGQARHHPDLPLQHRLPAESNFAAKSDPRCVHRHLVHNASDCSMFPLYLATESQLLGHQRSSRATDDPLPRLRAVIDPRRFQMLAMANQQTNTRSAHHVHFDTRWTVQFVQRACPQVTQDGIPAARRE